MLKKIPSDKKNGVKDDVFFLSRAPAYNKFTFNLQLLHELKHKVHLFETVCRIFHFRFRFVFIKVCICSTKYMDSLTLRHHSSFQD